MSYQPNFIAGSDAGLVNVNKPFIIPDKAYVKLFNAYVYRERVVKREGLSLLGRLQRELAGVAAGTFTSTGSNPPGTFQTMNIFTQLGLNISEPGAQVVPGTIADPLVITIGTQFLTNTTPNNLFAVTGAGNIVAAYINVGNGNIYLQYNSATAALAVTVVTMSYYPSLPVMAIAQREVTSILGEQTIFFDTKYAYIYNGVDFNEFIPGTNWDGQDFNFFWTANYRGVTPDIRLFFVTNFISTAANPMRYTDGTTWTTFAPLVTATNTLWSALILIPYYGRLIALNVWEGATASGAGAAVNIYNRCRFSAIGSPVASTAWRSDQFGLGGFIDAPTSEAITSAFFFKNTLIVEFESSTWQLRYVGEYGLPFVWERISSDFGSNSTFAGTLFDDGIRTIGDRAITVTNAVTAQRIDPQIPDFVYSIKNTDHGPNRIYGIRDFQRELVFWSYPNPQVLNTDQYFPCNVLVHNYRNNTYAIFRDNVTAFGRFLLREGITWDSQSVTWNDQDVTWDDVDFTEQGFSAITCGNQQGFIHQYGYKTPDDPSLSISSVSYGPTVLTVTNHNLQSFDIIYITGMSFLQGESDPGFNNNLFQVVYLTKNTISLQYWDFDAEQYVDVDFEDNEYIGNGRITLFPKMLIQTKDFNPYQENGLQMKLCNIGLLTDATPESSIYMQLFANASPSVQCNVIVGNTVVSQSPTPYGRITNITRANPGVVTAPNHGLQSETRGLPTLIYIDDVKGMTEVNDATFTITYIDENSFSINQDTSAYTPYLSNGSWVANTSPIYQEDSEYIWHTFFANAFGQYIRLVMSYNDEQMNTFDTHQQKFTLNAMCLYTRPGGRMVA